MFDAWSCCTAIAGPGTYLHPDVGIVMEIHLLQDICMHHPVLVTKKGPEQLATYVRDCW